MGLTASFILERNGQKTVVQAKRWKGSVGVTTIQEVYAGKALYGADAAMVVTNSRFTDEARRLAKSTGVVLWHRNTLRAELQNGMKRSSTGTAKPQPVRKPGSVHASRMGSLNNGVQR